MPTFSRHWCAWTRACAAAAIAASLSACGSNKTPTGPSPANVTVNAPAFLLIDAAPAQAVANIVLSNGGTTTTGATFSGSAPTVAMVSSTGLITPIAPGQVTVTASDGGQSGTATVRVLPNAHGTWNGPAVSATCSGTGSYSNCDPTMLGGTLALQVVLTQSNDQVIGSIGASGSTIVPLWTVTGTIAVNGTLTFANGSFQFTMPDGAIVTLTLQNWESTISSAGVLTATFSINASETDLTGNGIVGFTFTAPKS